MEKTRCKTLCSNPPHPLALSHQKQKNPLVSQELLLVGSGECKSKMGR